MSNESDRIDPWIMLPQLKTRWLGWMVHWYDSIDSTNRAAFSRGLAGGTEGETFVAEAQSRGRGRLGKSWFSPSHLNLYLSVLLRPRVTPDEALAINLVAGVTVAKVVEKLHGIAPLIKWPNDVLVKEKKLAGILGEMHTTAERLDFLVLGVGVNLNVPSCQMPKALRGSATSIRIETGTKCDRITFAQEFLVRMEKQYELFLHRGLAPFLSFLRDRSWLAGKEVQVGSGGSTVNGVVRGISPEGGLVLDCGGGRLTEVRSGTVSLVSG